MNASTLTASAAAASALLLFGATAAAARDFADVVSATPVTTSVAVPRQACGYGEQVVRAQPSGAGAVIGAIVGGIAGHQFGGGFGRAAATGAGVVAGSAIGNQIEADGYPAAVVPVRSCRTVSAYENRVVGYDVVYEYGGRRYTTRTADDPGPRLAIDVRPSAPPAYLPPAAAPGYAPPAFAPGAYVAPAYVSVAPRYYAPAPVYYAPPPAVVVRPVFGIGVWGGHGWHHRHRDWD